jgi:hypothetical protein
MGNLPLTETVLNSVADEILQGIIEQRFSIVFMLQYKHIRTLLHWGYNVSVNSGKFPPIESISVQLKMEYWAEVQVLEIERDEKVKAAKGLYFMAWRSNYKNVNN